MYVTRASLSLTFTWNVSKSEISAHFVLTVHQALHVPYLIKSSQETLWSRNWSTSQAISSHPVREPFTSLSPSRVWGCSKMVPVPVSSVPATCEGFYMAYSFAVIPSEAWGARPLLGMSYKHREQPCIFGERRRQHFAQGTHMHPGSFSFPFTHKPVRPGMEDGKCLPDNMSENCGSQRLSRKEERVWCLTSLQDPRKGPFNPESSLPQLH